MTKAEVGKLIKKAREDKGVSKYRVAKDTRLTAQQLGQIEKGATGFTIDTLLEVTNYLGLKIDFVKE